MTFTSERVVKAVRKRHVCDGCGKHIDVGQPANRWAGVFEGQFSTLIYHPDCREAEVELNNDVMGWQWGDDWCPLYDIDQGDWPWLREKHPAIAARMGLSKPEAVVPQAAQVPQAIREEP